LAILKTPLRYPGGKSRAMKVLGEYFPSDIKKYHEPFLGGGSIALWVTQKYPDAEIWVNDAYLNLANFWRVLQTKAPLMKTYLVHIKNEIGDDPEKGRVWFNRAKAHINEQDKFVRACWFYLLNKMSFSGLGESSGFSAGAQKQNFTLKGINTLPQYGELIKNWKITNVDWSELMKDDDAFVCLDPPYEISSGLYGKNGEHHIKFDHDDFAKKCNDANCDQLITYNADQKVMDRFPNYSQITWDLTYTMRSNSEKYTQEQVDRKELILLNYQNLNNLEKFL
jgi:site-specific DNA-adenine methylase